MKVMGIDLGTTNTVAAVGSFALPISAEDSRTTVPSVVSFLPNGSTQVGLAAKRRRCLDAPNTIFSAKRIIGRRWSDAETQQFKDDYPFDLVENQDGMPVFETRAGQFDPGEIASTLLSSIFGQARHFPSGIDATVVTVPSGFGDRQRQATRAAAEAAGLPQVTLIDEPMATAYAYLRVTNPVRRAGVYDLGGGTFDFSIVDWASGAPKILGFQSDMALGGDDIDRRIARWAAECVLEKHNWDLRNYAGIWGALIAECERAKIRLSFFEETAIDLSLVDPDGPAGSEKLPLQREMLDSISDEVVRNTFVTCDRVLAEANLRPSDLDAIFLAGGSTYLNKVREGVEIYFDKPGRFEIDPAEVVALGASEAPPDA